MEKQTTNIGNAEVLFWFGEVRIIRTKAGLFMVHHWDHEQDAWKLVRSGRTYESVGL